MLEREIKQILEKEQFEEILHGNRLHDYRRKHQVQINYYYDTKQFLLYENDITLRVRQKDSSLQIEMKYPVESKEQYKVKREISFPATQLPIMIDICRNFPEVSISGEAFLIHSLVTERTHIHVSDGITIDLDKSSYLGITDYELEIEFEEQNYEEAYSIYKSLLPYNNPQTSNGKNARFFKQYFALGGAHPV